MTMTQDMHLEPYRLDIRPVKINSMFYLSSREYFAENPGKKTQAKNYTIDIS